MRALAQTYPPPRQRFLPNNFWGHSIFDIPLYRGVKLIPMAEWNRMADAERFSLAPTEPDK
jgi:hypothetical protein